MSNVSIDMDALTAALSQALPIAIKTAIDAATQKVIEVPPEPKRKRGRPAKTKLATANTEIISVEEEILSVVNEPEQPVRMPNSNNNSYLFAAKRITDTGIGTAQATVEVRKKPGEIKFMDIANVGDRIPPDKYPVPTERRQPAQLMDFICDRCNHKFQAYPSECPQAFMKEKLHTGEEGRPRVLCERCIGA